MGIGRKGVPTFMVGIVGKEFSFIQERLSCVVTGLAEEGVLPIFAIWQAEISALVMIQRREVFPTLGAVSFTAQR